MAVKIRLRRMGAKKRPFYRFVVADSRYPRNGRFIEEIGFYNPVVEPVELVIKEDRAIKWLRDGAQPTDTVRALLNKKGIIEKAKDKDYVPSENTCNTEDVAKSDIPCEDCAPVAESSDEPENSDAENAGSEA